MLVYSMFGSQLFEFNEKIYLEVPDQKTKPLKKQLSGKTPIIMLTENDKLRANSLKQ